MGCRTSCLGNAPSPPSGDRDPAQSPSLTAHEEASEEVNQTRDVTYRRQMFIRAASSSTSSLPSSAMMLGSSRKKRKTKKRAFAPLSAPSANNNFDGSELSRSIIGGDVSGILNVNELTDKLIKDDPASNPPPPILPVSPPPFASRSSSTVSRFLARKTVAKNDEDAAGVSQQHQDDTPGSHRRQLSNENFLFRLPTAAAALTHRRTGSFEMLNKFGSSSTGSAANNQNTNTLTNPNTISASSIPISSAHSGDLAPTIQSMSSGGSFKDVPIVSSPPLHVGHRRQGSESSMFSRIVRVSSLTSPNEPELALTTAPQIPTCSTKTLKTFLEKQDPDVTEDALDNWRIKTFGGGFDDRWTFQQIQEYLFSFQNQAKDQKALLITHDMSRPISEYFVSTSHNTYLFGGQWITTGGKVDLQMYAKALRQGCRCVEIDVYDGPDGDPIVTHVSPAWSGGSVTFLEVCALIAKEAFRESRSAAPLILNLENNMNKQSKRAAEILTGAFGSRIVRVDDPEFGWEKNVMRQNFPTPSQLAGRVLCRSKPKDSSEEYQNLLYFRNSPWRFSHADEFSRRRFYQTSSLPENKVKGALKKIPADVSPVELHRAFLNRVYPRASAYASQNYNPLPYWLLGFQLVALNFQTEGLEMDLNKCMFERNSGSGFILKPALMRKARAKSRMNGGVRMSSRSVLSTSASRTAAGGMRPFGISTSALAATPTAAAGDNSPASGVFFSSKSLAGIGRFASRPFSGDPTKAESEASVPERTLQRNENSKSFMGVVEEALKNQNEEEDEDINDDEDDLPPPPPLPPTGAVLLPQMESDIVVEELSRTPPTPLSTLPPKKKRAASTLSPKAVDQSFATATISSSRPLSDNSETYSESPDLPTKSLVAAHDSSGSGSESVRKGQTSALLIASVARTSSDTDENMDEKKRRARARRRSTGSILKGPGDGAQEATASRKRSLEDAGTTSSTTSRAGDLVQSPASPTSLIPRGPFFDEEVPEDKIALNSVLIQLISLRCNVSRERLRKGGNGSSLGLGASGLPPVPPSGKSAPKAATPSASSFPRQGESEDDLSVDEEVYVELVVDGHPLDRVEKRTLGTVQLRGTQAGLFSDHEEFAAVLKDSETALFTLRLVDAWDSSSTPHVPASRSFFAHCLRPGTREIVLTGDTGGPSGFPIPYTLTVKVSPMYSIYSKATGRYELEEKVEPPVLNCPSRTSMIHCVVVACRSETPRIKMNTLDPFVAVQVIGIPTDSREQRTPRASRANPAGWNKGPFSTAALGTTQAGVTATEGSKATPNPRLSNLHHHTLITSTPSSTGSMATAESLGNVTGTPGMAGQNGGSDTMVVNTNSVSWMFPLVFTFAWSEFAFLRFCLRSNVNIDPETGAVISSVTTSSSRRRGSLVFRSNPTPTNAAQSGSGSGSGLSSSVIDAGSVVGKNMLWADAIRPGYRSIPLYLEKNPGVHVATLLCHFTLFDAREATFGPDKEQAEPEVTQPPGATPPKPGMYTASVGESSSASVIETSEWNGSPVSPRRGLSMGGSPSLRNSQHVDI